MLKILLAGCPAPSLAISSQFTLEVCVPAENREKILKLPILWVQGRSKRCRIQKFGIGGGGKVDLGRKLCPLPLPKFLSVQCYMHSIGQNIKSSEYPCVRPSVRV